MNDLKAKLLFIGSLIGVFSPLIIVFITNVLTILGVDTTGYVDIINMVAIGLSAIILIVAILLLNKYTTAEQRAKIAQNNIITSALEGNANLMETSLPRLADRILSAADERASKLLKGAEDKVNTMMNEMLPELAKQTMDIVTKQSQDIIDQTTAKAIQVMKSMDELIPTYAKQISDSVAQTVRENNAHYHKMLTELKGLFANNNWPAADTTPQWASTQPFLDNLNANMEASFNKLEMVIETKVVALIKRLMTAPQPSAEEQAQVEEPTKVEEPNLFATQNEETSEKSDEVTTS